MNPYKITSVFGFAIFIAALTIICISFLDLRESSILNNYLRKSKYEINKKYIQNHKYLSAADSANKIFIFLQLSDIHISIFRDPKRVPDLNRFLQEEIDVIRPEVVLVSGDLTDAKMRGSQASKQFEEEWKIYNELLEANQVKTKTSWLDIRGNHDAFDTGRIDNRNFFKQYSSQGSSLGRSYHFSAKKSFGTYSFITLDAVPPVGPKRPYNFFGFLSPGNSLEFQKFIQQSRKANQTFVFGHYPLSVVVSGGFNIREQIGQSAFAYFCGHLHKLGGLVPNMYTLHPEGFLELELGDWMDNRVYRLVVVDNDLVSFSDLNYGSWPVVHVSNPKDSRYLLPHKEPVHLIARSPSIHIEAFSLDPITMVQVVINDKVLGNATRYNSYLYTLPWSPANYDKETHHKLEVHVLDSAGRKRSIQQSFSVSGTPSWQFQFLPSFILLSDFSYTLRVMFLIVWFSLLLPVAFTRVFRYHRFAQPGYFWFQRFGLFVGFYRFAISDNLFYPWVIYLLYLGCGPIMFGYFLDDTFGFLFLNGLYVQGFWLPESFIYLTEFVQILVFHCPLLTLLCWRLRHSSPHNERSSSRKSKFLVYCLLLFQLLLSYWNLYLNYGLCIFLLSPCRLWQVPFGLYLSWAADSLHNNFMLNWNEHKS